MVSKTEYIKTYIVIITSIQCHLGFIKMCPFYLVPVVLISMILNLLYFLYILYRETRHILYNYSIGRNMFDED